MPGWGPRLRPSWEEGSEQPDESLVNERVFVNKSGLETLGSQLGLGHRTYPQSQAPGHVLWLQSFLCLVVHWVFSQCDLEKVDEDPEACSEMWGELRFQGASSRLGGEARAQKSHSQPWTQWLTRSAPRQVTWTLRGSVSSQTQWWQIWSLLHGLLWGRKETKYVKCLSSHPGHNWWR